MKTPTLTLAVLALALPLTACGFLKKDKDKKDEGTSTTETNAGGGGGATATAKPKGGAGCTLPEDGQIKAEVTLKKGCTVEVKSNIIVSENGTLRIEPGVKLLMGSNTYFDVQEGKIVAKGTEKEPILVTSANQTKAPGDWAAWFFQDKTNAGTELDWVKFEYGGGSGSDGHAAVDIRAQKSAGRISVTNCTFANNDQAGLVSTEAKGGFAKFSNNRFQKNKYSLSAHARVLGSVGTGNVFTDPLVVHGDVDESTIWPTVDAPIVAETNILVGGEKTAAVLTIQPKTVVKFAGGQYLSIGEHNGGGLIAKGVTFTSSNATPHAGDWPGIFLHPKASNVDLSGSVIEYAGEGAGATAAITVWSANAKDLKGLTVTGLVLKNNQHAGVSSGDHDCAPFNAAKSEGVPLCRKD